MPETPLADLDHSPDNEYEDLLGQWSDLEAFAGTLLTHPTSVQGFCAKVRQCVQWLDELAAQINTPIRVCVGTSSAIQNILKKIQNGIVDEKPESADAARKSGVARI